MALVNPHPALKVAVPMNPMVDGWMGDDWFHNGAFREQNMPYIYEQEGTRKRRKWWTAHFDDYDLYMRRDRRANWEGAHGLEQIGFWRKFLEHPATTRSGSEQAMDKILAAQPLKVPVMLVAQLVGPGRHLRRARGVQGDQAEGHEQRQGVSGPGAVASRAGDRRWQHAGRAEFGSDTGMCFRQNILRPFLDHYLKDDAPNADVAPVTAFETGTNAGRSLHAWPRLRAAAQSSKPLYLEAD